MKIIMRRRPLTGTFVTSDLIQLFNQFLIDVTSFRLSKSLYSPAIPYERTNNSGSFSPNVSETRIYQTKFPKHVSYLFHFVFLYHFNFSFLYSYPLFYSRLAMLSRDLSPVTYRRRNVEPNFTHTVNCCYFCYFPGLNLCRHLKA